MLAEATAGGGGGGALSGGRAARFTNTPARRLIKRSRFLLFYY